MTFEEIPTRAQQIIANAFSGNVTVEPLLERNISVQLDTVTNADLDSDGLSNDYVGVGHFLVAETTGTRGWFGSEHTSFRTKSFSYFLRDGHLLLREVNPSQSFCAGAGLQQVPQVRGGSSKMGAQFFDPSLEAATEYANNLARNLSNSFQVFIGNIDARPGNEMQLASGVRILGNINIAQLFAH